MSFEKILALRYLKPKRKEGFLRLISIFSFVGITLGVAVLIIVMSIMNGFRSELIDKIVGFNPHIIVKPYDEKVQLEKINKLKKQSKEISNFMLTVNGEGIIINNSSTKGVLIRGYLKDDLKRLGLLNKKIIDGSVKNFNKNRPETCLKAFKSNNYIGILVFISLLTNYI